MFDVDGTLIDSNDLHAAAWRETFLHFGCDISFECVRGQIGKGGDNLIPALLPPDLIAREAEIETYRSELFRRCYMERALPFPGVRGLFERLRADAVRIVLASSSHETEIEYYIGLLDIGDLLCGATSADDVAHSKPCPDIFEAALGKADVARADAVAVGDTPYDGEAAARVGVRMIGFRCGGFSDAALEAAGAAMLYDGPEDMLRNYPSFWFANAG